MADPKKIVEPRRVEYVIILRRSPERHPMPHTMRGSGERIELAATRVLYSGKPIDQLTAEALGDLAVDERGVAYRIVANCNYVRVIGAGRDMRMDTDDDEWATIYFE